MAKLIRCIIKGFDYDIMKKTVVSAKTESIDNIDIAVNDANATPKKYLYH